MVRHVKNPSQYLCWALSYYLPGVRESTDTGVAAVVTLVTFMLMAIAHISSGMLVFFFLIRGAFDTVCHWSFVFMVLGMCHHMHTISCYDLYRPCQICVFQRYLVVVGKKGMYVVKLVISIVIGAFDEASGAK